jgi:hypothetical protein
VTRVAAHGEVCDLRGALGEARNPGRLLVAELDGGRLSPAQVAAAEAERQQFREQHYFYDDGGGRLAHASALKHAAALCVLLQSAVLVETGTCDLGFSQSFTQGDSSYCFHLVDPLLIQELAKAVLAAPALRSFSGIPMAGLRGGALTHLHVVAGGDGDEGQEEEEEEELSAVGPRSGRATLHLAAHDGRARTDCEGLVVRVLASLLEGSSSLASVDVEVADDVYAASALRAVAAALTGSSTLRSLRVTNPLCLEGRALMGPFADAVESPGAALTWVAGLVEGTPSLTRLTLSPPAGRAPRWDEQERPLLVAALRAVDGAALSFAASTGETVGEGDDWVRLAAHVAGRPRLEVLVGIGGGDDARG